MSKVKIVGIGKLETKLKNLDSGILAVIAKQLAIDIQKIDSDVKEAISRGSRSGKIYGKHQASAPGEFPKTDTGRLVSGFFHNINKSNKNVSAELINKAPHAMPLEFKPAAAGGRPFIKPTFEKWQPKVQNNIKTAINRHLKSQGGK